MVWRHIQYVGGSQHEGKEECSPSIGSLTCTNWSYILRWCAVQVPLVWSLPFWSDTVICWGVMLQCCTYVASVSQQVVKAAPSNLICLSESRKKPRAESPIGLHYTVTSQVTHCVVDHVHLCVRLRWIIVTLYIMLTLQRYFIMEEGSSQTKDRLPGDNYGRAWYSDIQVGVPKHEVLWIWGLFTGQAVHMHQLILLGCLYGEQVPVWWYGSFPLGVIPYLLRGYPMLCIAAVSQQQCRLICSLFCLSEPWRKPRAESPVGLHHICISSYHFRVR